MHGCHVSVNDVYFSQNYKSIIRILKVKYESRFLRYNKLDGKSAEREACFAR